MEKVESNVKDIIIGAAVSGVFGALLFIGGLYVIVAAIFASPLFIGGMLIFMGGGMLFYAAFLFNRRRAYGIDLYDEYFIVRKGNKEIRIEKAGIEDFRIAENVQRSGYAKVTTYTLDIKYAGQTYVFDPKKYKNVFPIMCQYYGVKAEDALKNDRLWESIKDLLGKN